MSTSNREQEIRDELSQNDVTVARSYLEVDVMRWLSDNEIPFAYEAFVIPSVAESNSTTWDRLISAIQALGNGNSQGYENSARGTPLEGRDAFDALDLWNRIYDKHELAGEQVQVPVRRSLSEFNKTMLLPDFALYPDAGFTQAPDDFDYGSYSYLVEVSGLYGVGLPEESTEEDWWDWYRVSAVAFKEYLYRLLGLWDSVYWVLPNQPFIEDVSDGIPQGVRDDEHYTLITTTSSEVDLAPLADAVGITESAIDGGLSPFIDLTTYNRVLDRGSLRSVDPDELPSDAAQDYRSLIEEYGMFPTEDELATTDLPQSLRGLFGEITPVNWEYDDINMEPVIGIDDTVAITGDMIVYHGEMGEVYINSDGARVRESQWRGQNLVIIREYVMDVLSTLDNADVVMGLERVS